MELLNTLWTALTTENELLMNIIYIPITLIEITLFLLIFIQLLNISATSRKKLIYISSYSVISIFVQYLISSPYCSFINIILFPTLLFFIFKTNLLKSLLGFALPYALLAIVALVVQFIANTIFNISMDLTLNIPIYRITFLIIVYVILYLVYYIFKKFNIALTLINICNPNYSTLILNFIFGIFAIFIHVHLFIIYRENFSATIITISALSLIAYFLVSIYSLFRTNKLEFTQQCLEQAELYNKTLNINYDKVRMFKHDFNNIIQAMSGYISFNDMAGLKKYYSTLLTDCQKLNNLNILDPEIINNPAIYSLFTSKYYEADKLDIQINIEMLLDLNTVNMKMYELSRILGILLDNAIEASKQCEEKIINILIRNDSRTKKQLFIIENTYSNKDVNTDMIFEKGFTSKEDTDKKAHGLGLWEVRQILKKHNNLNLYTTKEEQFFKQQFEIYYT